MRRVQRLDTVAHHLAPLEEGLPDESEESLLAGHGCAGCRREQAEGHKSAIDARGREVPVLGDQEPAATGDSQGGRIIAC